MIEVISGADTGKKLDLTEMARLGSRGLADLVLSDSKVSGLHCELAFDTELHLKDLGSKNGTWIGSVRIVEATIPFGSVFRVGETQVRVEPGGIDSLEVPLHPEDDFHGLIGSSAKMRALTAQLQMLALSDASVLIQGETGCGKERVAQALHRARPGPKRPLIVVDCASLAPGVTESELFGHEIGAFTGASRAHQGAFARAGDGTVFLDEIGELPQELQPKLLRALGSRVVHPLGGGAPVTVNARVVSATNRDLALEVARGRFREDLYYRLAVITVRVPPLRERLEDIPLLASQLLRGLDVDPKSVLGGEALAALSAHDWPGNVRELENALHRAVTLMLPVAAQHLAASAGLDAVPAVTPLDLSVPFRVAKQRAIDAFERAYLTQVLEHSNQNVSEAARLAGVDRITIYRTLQRLGLRGSGA